MISVQGRTILPRRKNIHTAGQEVDGVAKGSPPAVACMGGNSELLATPLCRIRFATERSTRCTQDRSTGNLGGSGAEICTGMKP